MKTMNHKGFTIIELIFVILVTGILAAVALPKLAHMSKEAQRIKVIAFVGSLNRTVGPSMWGKALLTDDGKVDSSGANLCVNITNYIDPPDEITDFSADCAITVDTALGTLAINTFDDGDTVESPRWEIAF